MPKDVHALSRRYGNVVRQIVSDVTITNLVTGESCKTFAIWDTGATGCVISEDVAAQLKLVPTGYKNVSGISGNRRSNEYFINITLNNEQISLNSSVTDCNALSNDGTIGMLIGMDIISMGDFSITNFDGKTTMTFRIPSLEDVDFCRDINEAKKYRAIRVQWLKHGNKKCPCGSGKPWEKCHGKIWA